LVWYRERREYMRWIMAVTLPNTTACISAANSSMDKITKLFSHFSNTASSMLQR
jgi:hypothetical protein